jgi:hypothetical protein
MKNLRVFTFSGFKNQSSEEDQDNSISCTIWDEVDFPMAKKLERSAEANFGIQYNLPERPEIGIFKAVGIFVGLYGVQGFIIAENQEMALEALRDFEKEFTIIELV